MQYWGGVNLNLVEHELKVHLIAFIGDSLLNNINLTAKFSLEAPPTLVGS